MRRLWFEKVEDGTFGPQTLYFSPSYYACDLVFPYTILQIDPLHSSNDSLAHRNKVIAFVPSDENLEAILKIPVYQKRQYKDVVNEVEENQSFLITFRFVL